MATETIDTTANGEASGSAIPKTEAQLLQERHEANDANHHPYIEEALDEEDVQHPAPSMSAKAAGKQKASENPKAANVLDTKSEEAFPALGGGSKTRAPSAVPTAWGKKPSTAGKAPINGTANGLGRDLPVSSNSSSRTSTPAPGISTPASANTTGPRAASFMVLPGQFHMSMTLQPSEMNGKRVKPVLDDITRKSKCRVERRDIGEGRIVFDAVGPNERDVRAALHAVATQLGVKQTERVPVPASARPHIIGRQGANIQRIIKETGAKVQVPRPTETLVPEDDADEDATILVDVEGNALQVRHAKEELAKIVGERSTNVNMRLKEVPPEFFPFIAGPRNSLVDEMRQGRNVDVQVPYYDTWVCQPPPQVQHPTELPAFVPQPDFHIQISGDRNAALEVKAEIEKRVEELRKQLKIAEHAYQRGQHQFIIGERGSSLDDFLEQTGCAVVLPPETEDTEFITIVGPQDRLAMAANRAEELAAEMSSSMIDLGRHHQNCPSPLAHARALTKYLQKREAIKALEDDYSAYIVLPKPSDTSANLEIFSRERKNSLRARGDILKIVEAHPPSCFAQLEVDPFFRPHLEAQHLPSLRDELGVHMILPDEGEDDPVILVYEGPQNAAPDSFQVGRERPTKDDVATFEKALREAQAQIRGVIESQQDIIETVLEIPSKYQEKLRKFARNEQQSRPADELPVLVQIGESPGAGGRSAPPQTPSSAATPGTRVALRGPATQVEELESKIVIFIQQQEQDDRERGYTISFDFPKDRSNMLIGKRGETINKLREQFDVDIKVDAGKVEVKGPKAKAEACKAHIQALGKKLEDTVTLQVVAEPKFHRSLIGQKGNQVNRLQDRHNVRIQFPRSGTPASPNDDQSNADTASEVGDQRHGRNSQPPNVIIIRGPSKGANDCRSELLDLLQYERDHDYSASVAVAKSQIPQLMGKRGSEMENLRLETGAQIDVPSLQDIGDSSGRVEIKLKGTKQGVENAKAILERKAKEFDSTITKTIEVDKKYHRALIGSHGSNIQRIVVEAGGPADGTARMVKFPNQDSNDKTIRLEGKKAVVDKVLASIEAFVAERIGQVTSSVNVPADKHRVLIGRGGEVRRNLESKFRVSIDIPRQGDTSSDVKITGSSENVAKAKEYILELVKAQEGETVQVPRKLHNTIADGGQFFRRLKNEHGVTVDHGGEKPPARPKSTGPQPARPSGTNAPLITDEPGSDLDNHSWQVVDNSTDGVNEIGDIPWVFYGAPAGVAKAKALLQKAIESASESSVTGYLGGLDPRNYGLVIGPRGSQISAIRDKTGCKVNVPKGSADPIEVTGPAAGVEEAKDMILEAINNGPRNGRS